MPSLLQQIQAIDLKIVQIWARHPLLLRHAKFLQFLTRIGDGWVWGLVLLVLFSQRPWRGALEILFWGAVGGLISLLVYEILKLSSQRPRPFAMDPSLSPRVPPMDKYSFPSGHVMNNMAVGLSIVPLIPALGWPLVGIALIWGLLRVHFAVHYLSDILVGAILAIPCAFLAVHYSPFFWSWIAPRFS